jgi:uncharacterized membrane protein YecN with MAPEG domain
MTGTTFGAWLAPRRRILLWITAGYTTFGIVFTLAWQFAPRLDPIQDPLDRLLLAVQLGAGPAACVMAILQGLWRVGDTVEAEDPLSGKESHRFKINQRVMSNTVEQAWIFVPMLFALAVRMRPDHVWLLPVLVGIWCAGRMLFWGGYQVDPAWRAIGMDWTSSVAMITAGWLAFTLLN